MVSTVVHCLAERLCPAPADQSHGHRTDCTEPFLYKGTCQFECDTGYQLPAPSTSLVNCIVQTSGSTTYMEWDDIPTPCTGIWDWSLYDYVSCKYKTHMTCILVKMYNLIVEDSY